MRGTFSLFLVRSRCEWSLTSRSHPYHQGESNKLIAGLFTLARKLQPTIVCPTSLSSRPCCLCADTPHHFHKIFIDEIDSLLRNRGQDNHEVTSTIKAEFLTCVGRVLGFTRALL